MLIKKREQSIRKPKEADEKKGKYFFSLHLEYVDDTQKKSFEIYEQDKDSVCESRKDREKATHEQKKMVFDNFFASLQSVT